MTLQDQQLNSTTFPAWEMKLLNFMTFQVFYDLYEPWIWKGFNATIIWKGYFCAVEDSTNVFFQTFPREQAKSVNQCNRCKTNLFRYKLSARMKSDKFVCTLNVILFLVFPCWF